MFCIVWADQPTLCRTSLDWHHFDDLLARVGNPVAGIGTVVQASLIAYMFTMRTYLSTCLADIAVRRRVMLHEVCCCQADIGTVEQKIHKIGALTLLLHRICLVQADLATIQTVLNAVLHLLL